MINNSDIFSTPILFLVFNRFSTTQKVFKEIKKIQPPRIYIASDGPRANISNEFQKVQEIRNYILQNIDWDCEVITLFRDTNLGCKLAVSQAIDWFFKNEEMGIVLEDDCLPSQSFFWFCQDLLQHYKDDNRIFLINGYNHQKQWKHDQHDYFFSLLGGIWGWASWRRAWDHYDVEMKDINQFIENNGFVNVLGKNLGNLKQKMIYDGIFINKLDSWALQWGYARHKNNALTCIPSKSLIENIGFGEDATHTTDINIRQVKHNEINRKLRENIILESDIKYDELMFAKESLFSRLMRKIYTFLGK
jgi:hypothetical protein